MRVVSVLLFSMFCATAIAQDVVQPDAKQSTRSETAKSGEKVEQPAIAAEEGEKAKGEKKIESDEKAELQWKKYSSEEYDKVRFTKPTIVLIMRDLCGGCRAQRKKLWSSKEVTDALEEVDCVLFDGNAADTEGLEKEIKENFEATTLPVTIICNGTMGDEPVLLYRFPKPEELAKKIKAVKPESKASKPDPKKEALPPDSGASK